MAFEREPFVILDLETQRSFREVPRENLGGLKVSVLGIYDYRDGSYQTFLESEVAQFEEILKRTELLIGFNIRHFDLPVLEPYLVCPLREVPVLDLLEEIKKVRGHRVTLQSLAVATLNGTKSGSGLDAIRLYQEGKMEELKRYCLDDVRITKEVFEYGVREGKVYFRSERDFKSYEIPIDWRRQTELLRKKASSFPTSLF